MALFIEMKPLTALGAVQRDARISTFIANSLCTLLNILGLDCFLLNPFVVLLVHPVVIPGNCSPSRSPRWLIQVDFTVSESRGVGDPRD